MIGQGIRFHPLSCETAWTAHGMSRYTTFVPHSLFRKEFALWRKGSVTHPVSFALPVPLGFAEEEPYLEW